MSSMRKSRLPSHVSDAFMVDSFTHTFQIKLYLLTINNFIYNVEITAESSKYGWLAR